MATLEKLFAQIFERKDRIIEQVQHQADSYTQHLASRLLIDGITPPPWLLSPNFNSHSTDPNELEKEKIISKLLLRPPRASTRYSSGGCSLYHQPVVAGGNERLANELCMGTHAPNKDLSVSNEPMVTLERRNNDIVSSLNHIASEVDDSVNSPQYEVDARISSIYAAPDTSLARIQRSKSRQKARELRTNVKTTAKSCLSDENRSLISAKANSDLHQVTQDERPSDMGKCNNISKETSISAEEKGNKGTDRTSHSGRLRKSSNSYENLSFLNDNPKNGSSSEKEELEGDIQVHPTGNPLLQSGRVNGVMEGVNLPGSSLGSYTGKKSITVKTHATERQNKPLCGRITRSKSSSQQSSGINKSSELGTSSSVHRQEGEGGLSHCIGDLIHELNTSNKLPVSVQTSQVLSDRIGEIQAISSNEGELKQVASSNISVKESSIGAKQQENAKIHAENGPIDNGSSGSKSDQVTLCPKLEGLSSQSSDCCLIVKPKQLNFDEISECDLNEIRSPLSKKRKLDGLSGQKCYPSNESASSVDHKANSTSFEWQLLKASVSSCSPKAERMLSHSNIDNYAKEATENIDLGMNENPFIKDVERNSKVSLHDDIDVTCEVNTSPKEVDNIVDEETHTGKSHINEDHAFSIKTQIKEGDLGHKGEESAAVVYIPVSGSAKSLFLSSLTKQRNKDLEEDLSFSKSKDSEVGTHSKLSNIKMNSGKVTTWPLNRQRNFEDQLNCFSDSRGFRVHIQRDAIHCDLEEPKRDSHSFRESTSVFSSEEIHVSQSDGIQSCDERVPGEMLYDLADGSESLLELQAAEEAVTEVDNNTTETCVLKLIKNPADDSTYSLAADVGPSNLSSNDAVAVTENESLEISLPECVSECVSHMELVGLSSYGSVRSSRNNDKTMVVFDEIRPVYEGFVIDEEVGNVTLENPECGVDFDTLENPSTTIARASILEQICKSASMETPMSQFSSTFEQHQIGDLCGLMAGGIPEHIDTGTRTTVSHDENFRKHLQTSDSAITEVDSDFSKQHKFDSFLSAATPCYWQSKSHYSSPVGKLWERSGSSSGSSEKQLSSNPELTCFPIEEDPNSNEESENAEEMSDELQENMISKVENGNKIRISPKMELERREDDDEVAVEKEPPHEYIEACSQHVNPESTSMKHPDGYSSNSVSVPRTRDNVKYKPKNYQGIKISRYEEENRASSIATRASSRGNASEFSKNKSSTRNRIPRPSQKEAKHNNIVSNITSFIPIVQQKQAAAVCTGKREIKVKALEAAEAAKRREQEKENERKMKKEALKLERARLGKENAKEMELNKKKKQEELKKKEADLAARKRQRQREEDERKQVAKKRKLVAEAQKIQKLKYEKLNVGKVELEKQQGKNAANAGNKKVSENLRQNKNADENSFQRQDYELGTDKLLAGAVQQVASVPENLDASNDCTAKEKSTSIHEKSPAKVGPVWLTSEENSYDISPYQCSDDEDDEEDDLATKKFVPSWASKSRVAMVLPLQQKLDPESIFSVESFCSMDEVLLPRRLQQAQ